MKSKQCVHSDENNERCFDNVAPNRKDLCNKHYQQQRRSKADTAEFSYAKENRRLKREIAAMEQYEENLRRYNEVKQRVDAIRNVQEDVPTEDDQSNVPVDTVPMPPTNVDAPGEMRPTDEQLDVPIDVPVDVPMEDDQPDEQPKVNTFIEQLDDTMVETAHETVALVGTWPKGSQNVADRTTSKPIRFHGRRKVRPGADPNLKTSERAQNSGTPS